MKITGNMKPMILDSDLQKIEDDVKAEMREERVKVNFSSISLRADRVYVSREQAERAMASLNRFIESRKP